MEMNNDKIKTNGRKGVYIVLLAAVAVVITAASVHIFYQHSASSPAAPDIIHVGSHLYA